MIEQSFVFLDRIGAKAERRIWAQGIKNWDDFLKAEKVAGISRKAKLYFDRQIEEARRALHREEADYFLGKLPAKERWRLYDYFREAVLFLDIELIPPSCFYPSIAIL